MSWGEIKKALNKDPEKSLDVLIKEQFNSNNSNVSNINSNLSTTKNDVTYIKNTQLGTNLNNLLQGTTGSTVSFTNKPLVDKINYLLLANGDIVFSSTPNIELLNKSGSFTASNTYYTNIGNYTPKLNGQLTISVTLENVNSRTDAGLCYSLSKTNSPFELLIPVNTTTTPVTKKAILNVSKGQTIYFFLKSSGSGASCKCKDFKILGDIEFRSIF